MLHPTSSFGKMKRYPGRERKQCFLRRDSLFNWRSSQERKNWLHIMTILKKKDPGLFLIRLVESSDLRTQHCKTGKNVAEG